MSGFNCVLDGFLVRLRIFCPCSFPHYAFIRFLELYLYSFLYTYPYPCLFP